MRKTDIQAAQRTGGERAGGIPPAVLGDLLKRSRAAAGLTQRELAHHLGFMRVVYPVQSASSASSSLFRHEDLEYFYLLEGALHVTLGFEETELRAGDSMAFDATQPHLFQNRGKINAAGIWCLAHKDIR